MVKTVVPTNKPKLQGNVNQELLDSIREEISKRNISMSAFLEQAMTEYMDPSKQLINIDEGTIIVSLPQPLLQALEKAANEGFRPKEHQIILLLAQALGVDTSDLFNA